MLKLTAEQQKRIDNSKSEEEKQNWLRWFEYVNNRNNKKK